MLYSNRPPRRRPHIYSPPLLSEPLSPTSEGCNLLNETWNENILNFLSLSFPHFPWQTNLPNRFLAVSLRHLIPIMNGIPRSWQPFYSYVLDPNKGLHCDNKDWKEATNAVFCRDVSQLRAQFFYFPLPPLFHPIYFL